MYIIHKVANKNSKKSYAGSVWDKALLRSRYKEVFESLEEARYLVYMLNFYSSDKLVIYKAS
jgi:hypothetical protein